MSKYTTEVRFICETEAGYLESKGFNTIDDILTIAAPKVFNFDFPIFDENYRLPLEKKILRHYYTREISEETVGLWKLRLQDRLCMIMPYYNQLYESELIQFNPLYDVDVTTTHTGEAEGTEEASKEVSTETDSTLNKIFSEADHDESQTNTETDETINVDGNSTDSGSETNVKDTDISDHTVRDTDIRNDETISHDYSYTENDALTINDTTDDDLTHGKTVTTTPGVSITETTNGTKWDMHSDTPQGGLNGIISDDYLTDVHKILDDNLTTVRSPNGGHDLEANSGTDQRDIHVVGSHTNNNSHVMDEDTGDLTVRTEDEDLTKTYTDDTTNTTNFGKVVDTSEDTTAHKESEVNYVDNLTKNSTGTDTLDRSEQTDISDSRHITNTNEYLEHVVGKRGSMSYSKMLMEFRDSFLNIDKMVIDDLRYLFFCLWE